MHDHKKRLLIVGGFLLVVLCLVIGFTESESHNPEVPVDVATKVTPNEATATTSAHSQTVGIAKGEDAKRNKQTQRVDVKAVTVAQKRASKREERVAQQEIARINQQREVETVKNLADEDAERKAQEKARNAAFLAERRAAAKTDEERERKRTKDLWHQHSRDYFILCGRVAPAAGVKFYDVFDIHVIQVIDDRNALVDSRGLTYWITDINTRNMFDGRTYSIPGQKLARVSTKKYTTVTGASRTIPLVVLGSIVEAGISESEFRKALEDGTLTFESLKRTCPL